jgi:hypothetical protein
MAAKRDRSLALNAKVTYFPPRFPCVLAEFLLLVVVENDFGNKPAMSARKQS